MRDGSGRNARDAPSRCEVIDSEIGRVAPPQTEKIRREENRLLACYDTAVSGSTKKTMMNEESRSGNLARALDFFSFSLRAFSSICFPLLLLSVSVIPSYYRSVLLFISFNSFCYGAF
ncbi:unnamed protein product [Lathyrus oleraceus]